MRKLREWRDWDLADLVEFSVFAALVIMILSMCTATVARGVVEIYHEVNPAYVKGSK